MTTIKGPGNTPYEQMAIQKEQLESADKTGTARQEATGTRVSADQLSVSHTARLVNVGMQTAQAAPDTRADNVARLKALVQNGSYRPDARATAEKMLLEDMAVWK